MSRMKLAGRSRCEELLWHEYEIGKSINHQNIIKTIDFDFVDNYLILEYFKGVDLHEYIVKTKHYDPLETHNKYFPQLVDAVKYLHSQCIAHCDIKPENIIINEESGQLKLIDFGEATFIENSEGVNSRQRNRRIRGTLPYLPPEILSKDNDTTGIFCDKIDTWSCGIVLFNILFKSMPWRIADDTDKNFMIYKNTGKFYFCSPEELESDVKNLVTTLHRMLECNPRDRFVKF